MHTEKVINTYCVRRTCDVLNERKLLIFAVTNDRVVRLPVFSKLPEPRADRFAEIGVNRRSHPCVIKLLRDSFSSPHVLRTDRNERHLDR